MYTSQPLLTMLLYYNVDIIAIDRMDNTVDLILCIVYIDDNIAQEVQ